MTLADFGHQWHGSVLVVSLRGEIDMSNAEPLREALTALTPNTALALVLDLSAVEYLDSAGIQLLFRLRESVGRRGQGLRLVIPEGSPVDDSLRLAGMGREARAFRTTAEALQTVQVAEPPRSGGA